MTTTEKLPSQVCCRWMTSFFCRTSPWAGDSMVTACYVTMASVNYRWMYCHSRNKSADGCTVLSHALGILTLYYEFLVHFVRQRILKWLPLKIYCVPYNALKVHSWSYWSNRNTGQRCTYPILWLSNTSKNYCLLLLPTISYVNWHNFIHSKVLLCRKLCCHDIAHWYPLACMFIAVKST